MSNPYQSPSDDLPTDYRSPWPRRIAALSLYLLGWFISVSGVVWVFSLFGDSVHSHSTPDSELTAGESFQRYVRSYWFSAFLLIAIPSHLFIGIALRKFTHGPTAWKWLAISMGTVLPALLVGWWLFGPLLFPV